VLLTHTNYQVKIITMILDPKIFKAYDIRAIYPDQIDAEGAYRIGRAFVDFLNVKEVVVGNDMRTSVDVIKPALIKGINDSGAKVIDIGLTGTEIMYFTVGEFNFESGIMITASHNPPEYIGFKLVSKGAVPIGADSGIYDIRDLAVQSNYVYDDSEKSQNITNLDPIPKFKEKIESLVDFSNFKPMKIVVDAGNGVGGIIWDKIFDDTPFEVTKLFFEPDGTFPNHLADPLKPENVIALKNTVVENNADIGIAFDGDADRVFFMDGNGELSIGYYITALLSQIILKKYPGAKIVHENRNYWAIVDFVKEAGGIPVKSIAGHSYIKEKMREVNAVFAGETSSHLYYKDMHFAESAFLSVALILEKLSLENIDFYELVKPLKDKYFVSGEFNYKVSDADEVIEFVKHKYEKEGLTPDLIDGVAFDNNRKWHISVRKSNTQPLVRLNVEGESQKVVDKMKSEVEKIILDMGGTKFND